MKHSTGTRRALVALAIAVAAGSVSATPLAVDSSSSSVDVVPNWFGGTLLDSSTSNVSNPSYSGTARAAVYRSSGGSLDFYYQFSNAPASSNGVARFGLYDFATGSVNVYQTASGFDMFVDGTVASDFAQRSASGAMGVRFGGGGGGGSGGGSNVAPGSSSYVQIVRTDATNYVPGTIGLPNADGTGEDSVPGFAPASAPEPESLAMLFAGLGMMGFVRRRKAAR